MCSLCSDVVDNICDNKSYSVEQNCFLDFASSSFRHCDDWHYELPLPLRDSKRYCLQISPWQKGELNYSKSRFVKNPDFYKDYQKFVSEMISNIYAGVVEESGESEKG